MKFFYVLQRRKLCQIRRTVRPSLGGGVGLHSCGQDSRTLSVGLLAATGFGFGFSWNLSGLIMGLTRWDNRGWSWWGKDIWMAANLNVAVIVKWLFMLGSESIRCSKLGIWWRKLSIQYVTQGSLLNSASDSLKGRTVTAIPRHCDPLYGRLLCIPHQALVQVNGAVLLLMLPR